MRFFLKGFLPALALAIPCVLAWAAPASADPFPRRSPDARATVDRACGINYFRSKNVAFGPLACIHVPGSGIYKVAFKYPVDKCTVTGTLGVAGTLPGTDFLLPDLGEISLGQVPIFNNVVLVRTSNSSGGYDNGFRLNVECD